MTHQDRLEDLLDRWEASREQGQELSPRELCEDCPELADELAAEIRVLKRTDWLFQSDDQEDIDFLPLPPAESPSAGALVPGSLTLEQFTTNIAASGVMTADEVSGFDAADAQDLAASLLRSKKLTEYQAKLIAEGNTKGLVLGNYVILDKIGAGGMGQVFKARHRRMKRLVALKILPQQAVDSPTAVERFHREVEAAAKLEHPNIVTAYDADQFDATHFLVMQYVDGQDLASAVRHGGPMPVAKALDCVVQAAKGLEYAHGVGVVHRDIKPANLLLDKRGNVKILDMGLARLEKPKAGNGTAAQAQLTQDGTAMGTVDFMAPEQAMDTHAADARSDIYSLGCTLFYLLVGLPPYEGATLLAKMLAHKEADIPLLHEARDGVSPELSAVFQKMVAKQPGDRYQTATALLADLEEVADVLKDEESALETSPPRQSTADLQSKETSSASLDQTLHRQPAEGKGDRTLLCEAPGTDRGLVGPFRQKGPVPFSCAAKAGWLKLIAGGVAVLALAIFGWLYLPGLLFRVETPGGIIQIETNVSDVDVFVDNEKVVCLTDPKDQKKIRVELKSGAKSLTVSKDGFEADVSQFNLNTVKGPIKVSFVPVELTQEELPTTVDGDIDRQVAEWVLSVGGSVCTFADPHRIENRDELPSAAFEISDVILTGYTELDETGLKQLAQLGHRFNLNLNETNVTDSDLEHLPPVISYLSLNGTRITDAGLEHVVTLPKPEGLYLSSTAITDAGLRRLERLKILNTLDLSGTAITDTGLRNLEGLTILVRLILHDTKVTKEGVERLLKNVPSLQFLHLGYTELAEDHDALSLLQKVRPECAILLPGHQNRNRACRVLWLGGSLEVLVEDDVFPILVDRVASLPNTAFQITAINFDDNPFLNDACAERFQEIEGLKTLSLRNTALTNRAVSDLRWLKGLEELDLTGTEITAQAIEAVRTALPNCRVVWEGEAQGD